MGLALAAFVVTVVVTLDVTLHYRALTALAPAALFIAAGEVVVRYRATSPRLGAGVADPYGAWD